MTKEQHEKGSCKNYAKQRCTHEPITYGSIASRITPDTNNHNSIFGGRVLAYIDEILCYYSNETCERPCSDSFY